MLNEQYKISPWIKLDELGHKFYETRLESDFYLLHKSFKGVIISYVAKNYPNFLNEIKEIQNSVFASIYEHIGEFKPEYKFTQWAFTIIKNEVYTRIRKRYTASNRMNRGAFQIDEKIFDKLTVLNTVEGDAEKEYLDEQLKSIRIALDTLKEPYNSILKSRYIDEVSIRTLSLQYNVPENTIKTWTKVGINLMRKTLGVKAPKRKKGEWGAPLVHRNANTRRIKKLKQFHLDRFKDEQ